MSRIVASGMLFLLCLLLSDVSNATTLNDAAGHRAAVVADGIEAHDDLIRDYAVKNLVLTVSSCGVEFSEAFRMMAREC